jgi:transposase
MSEQVQKRFVGLDLHKQTIMIAGLNAQQEVVLRPRRVALVEFESWAQGHLKASDEVVLEATSNAWWAYDLLEPLVSRVVVASPHNVKLIAASVVKTDKKDALTLARLLAINMIPQVWVPPLAVRELRGLVTHRQRLIRQRTAARNRLRGLLHRYHLVPPQTGLFSPASRAWWQALSLPGVEQIRSRHDLGLLEYLEPLIAEVEAELARLSISDPWHSSCAFLIQLPGIGLVTAMTILAAVGQIERFPTAKKLVGYSGLGSRIYATGQTQRTGGITKQGRRELRLVMVEAAWVAVQHYPYWRKQFEQISARRGKHKAIVAIARKLLVVVWNVLTLQVADRQADLEAVARAFYRWSDSQRLAKQLNLSRAEFVRRELLRLGLEPEPAPPEMTAQPSPELARQVA